MPGQDTQWKMTRLIFFRISSRTNTELATNVASSQSFDESFSTLKIAFAGVHCIANTCKTTTPIRAIHSVRLRKKFALNVLLFATRALKALNTWNNTKVVKARL